MDARTRLVTPTTARGARLYVEPDASARLAAVGLHHTDPRYAFALAGVKAAAPERRAAVAERFRTTGPVCVALPSVPALESIAAVLSDTQAPNITNLRAMLCTPEMTWAARAEILRGLLNKLRESGTIAAQTRIVLEVLASVFESRCFGDIDCLEYAAWLALMPHPSWRAAARTFLDPLADTWLADWLEDNLEYREIAACAALVYDVPAYLT